MHSSNLRHHHNRRTRTAARAVVERMEDRQLLSGTLTIAPTNVASVILDVAPNGGIITIYDGNQATYGPGQFSAVQVTTKLNNETLEIRGTVVPVTVNCNVAGLVQFDGTSGLSKINADVTVNCLSGVTHVRIDDTGNSTPRNALFTWGAFSSVGVKNLAPAEIDYFNAGPVDVITGGGADSLDVEHVDSMSNLKINSSGGVDNVTVSGMISGPVTVSNTPSLTHLTVGAAPDATLGGGGANDTISSSLVATVNFNPFDMADVTLDLPDTGTANISVQRTDKPLNIVGFYAGNTDKITIGSASGMANINAPINITNPWGQENVELNDKADPNARLVQITSGSVTGLSNGNITWTGDSVNRLDLDTPMVGGNAVIVRSTGPETHINGQALVGGPKDTITVGDNQSCQGIWGELYITNTGFSNLSLDDSADPTSRYINLGSGAPDDPYGLYPYGTIYGVGNKYIYFRAADVTSPVNIHCASGGNNITVFDTPKLNANGQGGPTINLYTGGGSDTVSVQGTGAGTTLNLEGQSGIDNVTFGQQHDMSKILGTVNVSNNAAYDLLTLDDSTDPKPRTVTLDALAPNPGQNTPRGSVTGLSPGTINYDAYDLQDPLNILAGPAGNTFVVNNTPVKLVGSITGNTINLKTGTGVDNVNVKAVGPGTTLNINGQDGQDTITVGNNGSVQQILGTLSLSNDNSHELPTIDDSADPAQRIVTVNVLPLPGNPVATITGLAPGAINYVGAGVVNPTVKAGPAGNIFTVLKTPTTGPNTNTGPTLYLNTGNGNDIVSVQGMGVGTGLSINGQDGSDSATIDYSTGAIPLLHTLTFDGDLPGPNQNTFTLKGATPLDNFILTNGLSTHGVGKDYFLNAFNLYLNTGTFNANADLNLLGLVAQTAATHLNFNTPQTITSLYDNGAAITTAPGGSVSLALQKLTIDSNGSLDLADNSMLISYNNNPDPVSSVRSYLATGYASGAWTGAGINSSVAAANPLHNTALGYADSKDGTGVNNTFNSVEFKYTLNGDTNLDGNVDIFDLNALLPHFNSTGAWTTGDSTYNSTVDVFDLNAMLPNFNHSLPPNFAPIQSQSSAMASALSDATTSDQTTNSPRHRHASNGHFSNQPMTFRA